MTMSVTRVSSAAGEVGKQGLAQFGASLAAVLRKEDHHRAQGREVGALDAVAAALLRGDEPCLGQDGEMRRECALREGGALDQLSGGQSLRLMRDERAERIEAGRVGQRGERGQGFVVGHASALADELPPIKNDRLFPMRYLLAPPCAHCVRVAIRSVVLQVTAHSSTSVLMFGGSDRSATHFPK